MKRGSKNLTQIIQTIIDFVRGKKKSHDKEHNIINNLNNLQTNINATREMIGNGQTITENNTVTPDENKEKKPNPNKNNPSKEKKITDFEKPSPDVLPYVTIEENGKKTIRPRIEKEPYYSGKVINLNTAHGNYQIKVSSGMENKAKMLGINIENGDSLKKQAKMFGLNLDDLQQFQTALSMLGVESIPQKIFSTEKIPMHELNNTKNKINTEESSEELRRGFYDKLLAYQSQMRVGKGEDTLDIGILGGGLKTGNKLNADFANAVQQKTEKIVGKNLMNLLKGVSNKEIKVNKKEREL